MKSSLQFVAALVAVTLALLGSAKVLPIDEDPDNPVKNAPTKFRPPTEDPTIPRSTCGIYVLVGADSYSNPYSGDTSTTKASSLLCIHFQGASAPPGLPPPVVTPGGALKNSWSGGDLFVVPKVLGTDLTSPAVADNMCATHGAQKYGMIGARMAEFHDGDNAAGWAGWGFWGIAAHISETFDGRLWTKINDQNANPWDNGAGLALTFIKKKSMMLCL